MFSRFHVDWCKTPTLMSNIVTTPGTYILWYSTQLRLSLKRIWLTKNRHKNLASSGAACLVSCGTVDRGGCHGNPSQQVMSWWIRRCNHRLSACVRRCGRRCYKTITESARRSYCNCHFLSYRPVAFPPSQKGQGNGVEPTQRNENALVAGASRGVSSKARPIRGAISELTGRVLCCFTGYL